MYEIYETFERVWDMNVFKIFHKSVTKIWNITLYHKHIKYESILQNFY